MDFWPSEFRACVARSFPTCSVRRPPGVHNQPLVLKRFSRGLGRSQPRLPRNVNHVADLEQTPDVWKPTSFWGRRTLSLSDAWPQGVSSRGSAPWSRAGARTSREGEWERVCTWAPPSAWDGGRHQFGFVF